MEIPSWHGIDCQGLDATSEADERLVSDAILKARLFQDQHRPDEAAREYALAGVVELRLAEACEAKGLKDKAWVHRFGAVRARALAGNIHDAIALGEEMLSRPDLSVALRQRVTDYLGVLRVRRAQWSADLTSFAKAGEP